MSFELISLDAIQKIAQQYGYAAVFFGILLENTGIPIPGETITVVGGFLAGNTDLSYWGVLGSSTAGAIIGDSCGYWIGAYGGWTLLTKLGKVFRISDEQLEEGRRQFSQNAAKAVFLGRFITLLRIFAGPLAGIAQMPYSKFLLYNAAGASLWSLVIVSLSYFVGRFVELETLISWIAKLGALGLVIVAIVIGVSLWLERRGKLVKPLEPLESQE